MSMIKKLQELLDKDPMDFLGAADEAYQQEKDAMGDVIKPQEAEAEGLIKIKK